jgi:transglutaminase-like putative cysteine protease
MRSALVAAMLIGLALPAAVGAGPPATERRFRFEYVAAVPELPESDAVELWLPVPLESLHQDVAEIEVDAPAEWEIVDADPPGNRYLKVAGLGEELGGRTVALRFRATRRAVVDEYEGAGETELDPYLAPDALVPIDGEVRKRANLVAVSCGGPKVKARDFYEDLVWNMKYDKSGEGWGRGDALYACHVGRGNCTDFHSLFIGMCRAFDVPARFTIGFPLPADLPSGEIGGYHCWAEFHLEDVGWLPVDASEASKHPERTDELFGRLDPDRIEFARGRDLHLPGHPELEPLNFFIYPVLLVDGRPTDGVETRFTFEDES